MTEQDGKTLLEERLEEYLDKFNESLKLDNNSSPIDSFNKYTKITKEEIEKYNSDECHEIATILMQYSIYLQRALNREMARAYAVSSEIYKMCASHWNDYDKWTAKDIRVHMIANELPHVKKMVNLETQIKVRIEEISN